MDYNLLMIIVGGIAVAGLAAFFSLWKPSESDDRQLSLLEEDRGRRHA